jgi:uncharacterized protein
LIIVGFSIGLLGGLHCVGMCGPLQLAAAGQPMAKRWKWVRYQLAYQSGRMLSYGFLGAMIALLGRLFVLGGWQNTLSLIIGFAILLFYVVPNMAAVKTPIFWNKAIQQLKQQFGKHLQRKSLSSQAVMGMLNGLLPCGLVYLALATAALSDQLWEGFAVMAAFGAGTLPWLMAVLFLGSVGGFQWRLRLQKFTPYMAALVGVLLILRGLDIHWMHLPMLGQTNDVVICE